MIPSTIATDPVKPAGEQLKGKTKAKQRYLKRKKERRKQRKSHPGNLDAANHEGEDKIQDESGEEVTEEKPTFEQVDVVEKEVADEKEKARKRRKLDHEMDAVILEEHPPVPEEDLRQILTPSLPSFPLPVLPNPPSQYDLARQGLDQALAHAELVQATTVLPINTEEERDLGTRLSLRMRKRLKELGINELFAVQSALLPFILHEDPSSNALYLPYDPPRDVCVSAPTGSGKTLAYALPIIEILSTRIVTRLRALIVLPTRDLVAQVRETFEAIGKGRGLKVGVISGQHSFAHEQTQLVADRSSYLKGGSSKVDILICTPGRLIDHLNSTPNFSLQHLRFLVIDEADRLLAHSFQDWLAQVLAAIRNPFPPHSQPGSPTAPSHPYPDAVFPSLPLGLMPTDVDEKSESSCQKFLFSATLTRDPGKIASLDLRDPKYFLIQNSSGGGADGIMDVAMAKYTLPTGLKEHMIICEPSQKPLMLLHLIHNYALSNALVFTKSTESTTRLVKLIEFFENAWAEDASESEPRKRIVVHAYSSDLKITDRKAILQKFKAQDIQILVCSDLISRGIDISHISHVVSYDVPVDMRKYIHRVGRTARAGRSGDAWTLVESQEARYFKTLLREAAHWERVKRVKVSQKALAPLTRYYELALARLKDVYAPQS